VVEYYSKMCGLADELVTTGHPLGDEEFVSYVLVGLDEDFDPMVFAVVARIESISPTNLYSQMLSHELRRDRQSFDGTHGSYSSANAVVHRRDSDLGRFNGQDRGRGRGGRTPAHNNNSNSRTPASHSFDNSNNCPRCQVCLGPGHMANIFWYRFDEEYAAISMNHGTYPNWYLDSSATDHIIGELDS
jgi:hypothetical protein